MRWALMVVLAAALAFPAAAPGYVYWTTTSSNAIGRANLDGTRADHRFIVTPVDRGLVADATHVFWTGNWGSSTIGRANVDRTDLRTALVTGTVGPFQLALNATHVYWPNAGANSIGRAKHDGTEATQSFITGININGMTVGPAYVYWTNGWGLGRAKLDGSEIDTDFIRVGRGGTGTYNVVTDGEYLYWDYSDQPEIGRARIDGSELDIDFIPRAARGLAVDGQYLYWSNGTAIARANRDGTGIVPQFIPTTDNVSAVAVNGLTSAATTTTLNASAATSFYGDPTLTFTAQVASPTTATGTVQFQVNGVDDGAPVPLDALGRAVYDSSFYLDVGDRVTARYSGDLAHDPSDTTLQPDIRPAATRVSVTSSPNPSAPGQELQIVARVSNESTDFPPYGSAELLVDGAPVGTFELDEDGEVAIVGGEELAAGVHSFAVRYTDDTAAVPNFQPSTGSATHTVQAPPIPARPVENPAPPTATLPVFAPPFAVVRATTARTGAITLLLSLPGAGVVTGTASGYGRASKSVTAAGRVTIVVRPSAKARRALAKGKTLKVSVRLRFQPQAGGAATTIVRRVTVKGRR